MKLTFWQIIPIGMMLFSSFFGAGNLIFPPALGQAAGSNALVSTIGFILTGVGMPLLGIVAIAKSGSDNPNTLASRVHPKFGMVVTVLSALTIGPLFAIPRTGAVSFDMGLRNFIPLEYQFFSLLIYSFLFFLATFFLSINPGKIVAWVGKILSPLLLGTMAILIGCAFINPMGEAMKPTGSYVSAPFFRGFEDGYLTMDLLAALMFGGMTIDAIRAFGVKDEKDIEKTCIYSGVIAAVFLSFIYASLAYMGVTSVSVIGMVENGGIALAAISKHYLGFLGSVVLAFIIFFACLTTSIGVTASVAAYFTKILNGKVQYDRIVAAICIFSFGVANVGLTNIISLSIPLLSGLYPIIIGVILLPFFDKLFGSKQSVYRCSMFFMTLFSILTAFNAAGIHFAGLERILVEYLPFFTVGFGWVMPALVGALIGYVFGKKKYYER